MYIYVYGHISPYIYGHMGSYMDIYGNIYGHMMELEEDIHGIMRLVYRESFIPKTRLQTNIRFMRDYYTGNESLPIGTMK